MSENKPSKETIDGLVAAAPDLRLEMMNRLTNVARCLRAALADERVDEVGQAWLRTALAKIEGGNERATYAQEDEQPPDLVASGPPDEFPPGYHPRTGQKLDTEEEDSRVRRPGQ